MLIVLVSMHLCAGKLVFVLTACCVFRLVMI